MAPNGHISTAPKATSLENARVYCKRLNNRARADIDHALDRLTKGDWKDRKGSHGRRYHDQLCHQILEDPLGALQWINDHTPCDEGTTAPAANALITNNIGALYLTAMQRANEQQEAKTIEPDPDRTW